MVDIAPLDNEGNGTPKPLRLTLLLDRQSGQMQMQGPDDVMAVYAMLRGGLDMVMEHLNTPEPERQVKTLDELGIRRDRRT